MANPLIPAEYADFLTALKKRIRTAQSRAAQAVNAELVRLYWDIGRSIRERQEREGWGAAVIPRLAADLKNELPELKGFSARNLDRMIAFFREYPYLFNVMEPPTSKPAGDQQITESSGLTISPTPLAKSTGRRSKTVCPPSAERKKSEEDKGREVSPTPLAKLCDPDLLPIVREVVAQLSWAHNVLLIQAVKDLPTRLW